MNIKYRSEIDGLRAIAVLLVIFNHLGATLVSGGFVGVDIFFVISGFLITSIIKQEVEDKTFSFRNFYKKRIIRLAPAYFLVLLATTLAMLFMATPNEFLAYAKSVLYSSVFAANFYMWRELGGYFSANAELTPLLHLWSLGIEEQFYIFWPVILIILSGFLKKLRIPLIVLALLLSAVISQKFAVINPAAAYFLLPFRGFELLIGALLSFIPYKNAGSLFSNILSCVGLAGIFASSIIFSDTTVFPGFNALIPCIGTALVIYFCRDGILQKVLSSVPMSFVGKVSYPAYLWHWPLIVILNFYYIEISFFIGLLVLALTLSLAWATYNYVEKPFTRFRASSPMPVIFKGYFLPLFIVLCFVGITYKTAGFPARFDPKVLEMERAIYTHTEKIRGACLDGEPRKLPSPEKCKLGIDKSEIDFLLLGDSHANHFAPMVDVLAKDAKLRGYDVTQNSTLFLPNIDRYSLKNGNPVYEPNFKVRNDALIEHLKQNNYKYVVLAGSYAESYKVSSFKRDQRIITLWEGLESTIELIDSTGAKPVLIVGSPRLTGHDQACPVRKHIYDLNINCNISRKEHDEHFKKWRDDLAELISKHPELIVVDPTQVMCSSKECFTQLDGIPLYKDTGHLNHVGATKVGEIYLTNFGNPFIK